MAFEELQERFKSELQQTLDRLQESPIYNQLRDRYDNLSPSGQKAALAGAATLITALVLSLPYGYYSQSALQEDEFIQKRETLRSLLKVTREAQDIPQMPTPPDVNNLRSLVENRLQNAQLLPEQMQGISIVESNSKLIPAGLADAAIAISLAKINLKQANDLAFALQSLNPSVKLSDLSFKPNSSDPRYFDFSAKLISLKVPQIEMPELPERVEK